MLEWLPFVFIVFLGLAVGSHLNVLILRFGFEERSSPRSECAQCGAVLAWHDLVPVLSYLVLRGRCRSCGSAIQSQYPFVELATAACFAAAYLFSPPAMTVAGFTAFAALLAFITAGIGIVVYDMRHTLVPLPFAYGLIISAFVFRLAPAVATNAYGPVADALLGGVSVGGFFAAISILTRGRGMGIGDAYIAAALGILLGLMGGVSAAALGVWSATAAYLLLMLSSRIGLFATPGRVTMKTELPFAPWLLFGAAIVLTTGVSLIELGAWIPELLP